MITGFYNPTRGYALQAANVSYRATVNFTHLSEPYAYVYVSHLGTGDAFERELNKDEITRFLSLDCADDFIKYALSFYKS